MSSCCKLSGLPLWSSRRSLSAPYPSQNRACAIYAHGSSSASFALRRSSRAICAILASFVSIGRSVSGHGLCFLGKADAASPAFPPRALPRLFGTMRRSDSPPPFGSLASSACRPYSLRRAVGVSRVTTSQDCTACQGLRPREARVPSP